MEEYDAIVAMKEEPKESITKRMHQVTDRLEVWKIQDSKDLPAGYDKMIFEEIKRKLQKMANVK